MTYRYRQKKNKMNDNYMAGTASEEVSIPRETPLVGEESTTSTSSNKIQRNMVSATQKTQNSAEAEVENKNTEQEEEGTFTPQYIACQGAICRCNQGSSMPTLQVNTHRKYYVNDRGNNKLVATVKDLLFNPIAAPFGSCSVDNGRPCTYSAQEWKVSHNTDFPKVDGLEVLTEKGKLQCLAKQGEITLITHGQTQHIALTETEEVITALATLDHVNTLLRFDRLHDIDEDTYVSQVTSLTLNNLATLCASVQGAGTNRALIVLKGEELQFTAQTPPNETGKYISWSISEALGDSKVLEDGKKGTTFSAVITTDNGVYQQNQTTSRYFGMTALRPGIYVVSAASKEKNDPSKCFFGGFYYYIQVVDRITIQEVTLSNAGKCLVIGDELTITVLSDIPLNSGRLESVSIRVSVDGIEDNDGVVYKSKGAYTFKQEGNQLIALFKTVNANMYKVEVYEGEVLSPLAVKKFEVVGNAVICITPSVDKVRVGSEGVFGVQLKRESKTDLATVSWKLKNPQGTYEQAGVGATKHFRFTQAGIYTVICEYDTGWFTSKAFTHKITVVKNELESIRIEEGVMPSAGDKPNGVYLYDPFTVSVATLIPYKKPQQENSYVKQINKKEDILDAVAQFVGLKKNYVVKEQLDKNVDPEIIWTITYRKGDKKGSGLTMQYGAITPETSFSSDTTAATAAEELAPIFIGLTSIKSLTNQVMICSNTPAITLAFIEVGTYDIVAMMNDKQIKYTVVCVPGRIERWEFVDSDDNHIEYLSYNEDFYTTAQIKGYENKSAKIYYWFSPRESQRVLLAKDYVHFNEEGVFTHAVHSNGEFWKNYHSKVGSAQENVVHFTIEQKVGIYNASVHKTSKKELDYYNKEAKDPIKQRITTLFSTDMPEVYGKICRHFTYEAYFKNEGQRLVKHIKYGEAVAIYIRLIRGREDYTQTLETVSLQVRVLENTKQEWGKRVDRQVELIEVSEADRKQKTISLALDTTKQEYRQREHKEEIGNPVLPRLIYFTVEYTHRLQGRDQSKAEKIKDALIFPYRYEMHGDNDAMLTELLDPTADEATLHKNIALLEQLKQSGKAERYFDQLKLVENLAFEDAFKSITRAVRVARIPDKPNSSTTNKVGCPNCKANIEVEQLAQIFPKATVDSLRKVADAYNKYMDYFSLDTCRKKAYFFAAASVEAGPAILGKYGTTEEDMNYSRISLLEHFPAAFFDGKWKDIAKQSGWISSIYVNQITDRDYEEHDWYATVKRGNVTLYIQIEDQRTGYLKRIFKDKAHWDKVVEIENANGNSREKTRLLARFAYWNKNGNKTEDDGENYRGSGLVQLTGKGVYTKVQEIIKNKIDHPTVKSIMTKQGAESVRTDLEIGMLASMGYFAFKKLNAIINELPRNGKTDTDKEAVEVWKAIGLNIGKDENGRQSSYTKKTLAYQNQASEAFWVAACTAHMTINPKTVDDQDIITYEINYNSIGSIEKEINGKETPVPLYIKKISPKAGENKNPNYCKYVYIDKSSKRHEICVLKYKMIQEVYLDKQHKLSVYADRIVDMIDYVMAFKGYESSDGMLSVGFNRDNSKEGRRYAVDIDCFAALLGAMCDQNIDCISFNGASNFQGFPTPSKSHINGRVFDVGYIPKNGKVHQAALTLTDANFDVERQIVFNNALYKYGFARTEKMLSETFTINNVTDILPYCTDYRLVRHNNHLHIQGYSREESIIDETRV